MKVSSWALTRGSNPVKIVFPAIVARLQIRLLCPIKRMNKAEMWFRWNRSNQWLRCVVYGEIKWEKGLSCTLGIIRSTDSTRLCSKLGCWSLIFSWPKWLKFLENLCRSWNFILVYCYEGEQFTSQGNTLVDSFSAKSWLVDKTPFGCECPTMCLLKPYS